MGLFLLRLSGHNPPLRDLKKSRQELKAVTVGRTCSLTCCLLLVWLLYNRVHNYLLTIECVCIVTYHPRRCSKMATTHLLKVILQLRLPLTRLFIHSFIYALHIHLHPTHFLWDLVYLTFSESPWSIRYFFLVPSWQWTIKQYLPPPDWHFSSTIIFRHSSKRSLLSFYLLHRSESATSSV